MATYTWSIPTDNIISGLTYIKDTDNKIQATMDDLVDFVNGEGSYTGQGLTYDFVNKITSETITGIKTFSNGIVGDLTGNASSATKLATARSIQLAGEVTGSISFDGTTDVTMYTSVANDSHTHTTSNITDLASLLSEKQDNLVSGTNIKTIDGVSLLGGGNISTVNLTDSVSTTSSTIGASATAVKTLNNTKLGDSGHSFSANGYQKLSNGLIIQWGYNLSGTVTIPISYPNSMLQTVATQGSNAGSYRNIVVDTFTSTSFRLNGESGIKYYWVAIGY